MNEQTPNSPAIVTQPQLFKIEPNTHSRPGQPSNPADALPADESSTAQPDMFGVLSFK